MDGNLVCIGLDIRCFRGEPGNSENPVRTRGPRWEPITSGLVRGLRVQELVRDGRKHLDEITGWLERQSAPTQKAARKVASRKTAGRPASYDDAHYRRVADLYRANQGYGVAKAVHAALQAEGYPFSSPDDTNAQRAQVRKWIAEARTRRFI